MIEKQFRILGTINGQERVIAICWDYTLSNFILDCVENDPMTSQNEPITNIKITTVTITVEEEK